MNNNTQSTNGMNENEIRIKRASLTRDLISLKDSYRKNEIEIEKLDLNNRYLGKDKVRLAEDIENRKGKVRVIENEISQLETTLVEKNKERKMILLEAANLERTVLDMDAQIKENNHKKERWQDEMQDMSREIKKLEVEIREM